MSISSGFSHVSSQRSASNSPEKRGCVPAGGRMLSGRDLNLGFSANLRRRNGSAPEFFHQPEKMVDLKSLDLFPQQAGFGISNDVDSSYCKSTMAAPQTSQMTIFYAGQVFVFNNFSADRVGEVMFLAGRENSKLNIPAAGQPVLVETPADSLSSTSPISSRNLILPPPPPLQPQPVPGALPMARKASIQRFMEKRKDRLTARAPYLSGAAPSKTAGAGDNSWLGLAVQPQH